MSEIIPPEQPQGPTLPPVPPSLNDRSGPLSKKLCAFLGFLLFVIAGGLTYVNPLFCVLGFVVAVGSLFFKGYRCIFLGYIITIGCILLGMIIYCSTHPFRMD